MILNFFKKNDIESFLGIKGIKVIEFFIKKSILSQPELLKDQKALPIQIPKEHLEQWLCHALKAEPRGSGSYPVDIIKNNKWAADVKMVSHKLKKDGNFSTGQSGETSLGQKFVDIGKNLDLYFQNSQFDKILDGYLDVFSKKYKAVEKDYNINIFFYFMFIRVKNKFFLSIVSLDLDKLEKVEVDYSSITNTTLSTKNFINKNNGSVVIYKSKKRMELRLKPSFLKENNLLYEFDIDFGGIKQKDIYNLVDSDQSIVEYLNKYINDLFLK